MLAPIIMIIIIIIMKIHIVHNQKDTIKTTKYPKSKDALTHKNIPRALYIIGMIHYSSMHAHLIHQTLHT